MGSARHGNAQDNLASVRVDAKHGNVTVTSPAFAEGQPIPDMYSDYGKHLSPPLDWSDVPDATRAFDNTTPFTVSRL